MTLLHQFVITKPVDPELLIISCSQSSNLNRSLCRAKLRQPLSEIDEQPRPSQSCGKSLCKLCMSLVCYNFIARTARIKDL